MQKATYRYSSGHVIKFPAHGNGPRLFLEWIANYQATQYKTKRPDITFKVRLEDDPDDVISNVMVIRDLFPMLKDEVKEIVQYINDNQ
jgi:hypothetical protein